MESIGRFSRPFFLIGLSVALALTELPFLFSSLRSSALLDLLNLIFFPPSLLLSFTEKAPSTMVQIAIIFSLIVLNGVGYSLVGLMLDRLVPIFAANNSHQVSLVAISDLPLWKRILVVVALCYTVLAATGALNEDLAIWATAPDHPIVSTGQMYRVYVNHGHIRYLTAAAKDKFDLWSLAGGPWAGAAFLGGFFLYFTSGKNINSRRVR
jgi:hypothetical protein